jgi:transcriptional regulator with XRE-family HTH domain
MAKKKRRIGPDPIDQHVGTRLRMRRLMLGLSQTDLGVSVGLTFQQIQKYEKGANRISSSRLQEFSNVLKAPVPFFFEGSPNEAIGELGTPVNVSDFFATSEGLSLAKSFMKIKSAKLHREIAGLVESLA